MKIVRKNDEFKKMPDRNWLDAKNLNKMIDNGWKYVSRKEWKDYYNNKEESIKNK